MIIVEKNMIMENICLNFGGSISLVEVTNEKLKVVGKDLLNYPCLIRYILKHPKNY
jgi:hypothetical protein